MRGLKSVIIVSVILLMISGCTITKQDNDKETEVSDMVLNKYADYLYYLELDSYNFEAMPANDSPLFTGGCSSIRKDNLYGRNYNM